MCSAAYAVLRAYGSDASSIAKTQYDDAGRLLACANTPPVSPSQNVKSIASNPNRYFTVTSHAFK